MPSTCWEDVTEIRAAGNLPQSSLIAQAWVPTDAELASAGTVTDGSLGQSVFLLFASASVLTGPSIHTCSIIRSDFFEPVLILIHSGRADTEGVAALSKGRVVSSSALVDERGWTEPFRGSLL